MANPKFVWIIRSWCSEDTFWEHVREHKEYDIAYRKPESLLEEINRIILKEQVDWDDLCESSGASKDERLLQQDIPTLEQIKTRSFYKFLTISSQTGEFMQSWYVERLKVAEP
jgi:hypothetical protein